MTVTVAGPKSESLYPGVLSARILKQSHGRPANPPLHDILP